MKPYLDGSHSFQLKKKHLLFEHVFEAHPTILAQLQSLEALLFSVWFFSLDPDYIAAHSWQSRKFSLTLIDNQDPLITIPTIGDSVPFKSY